MKCYTAPPHDPAESGKPERDVLLLVRRDGSLTTEQVVIDSAVRIVPRRLQERGYLALSVKEGNFVYRSAEPRQRLAGLAVKRTMDWSCWGSIKTLLAGLAHFKVPNATEFERMATYLEVKR
jgi:predicted transcriptional regulator